MEWERLFNCKNMVRILRNASLVAALLAAVIGLRAAEITTSGTGKTYTFADLAALDQEVVEQTGSVFKVLGNVTVASGDCLSFQGGEYIMLSDNVEIGIQGTALMQPSSLVTITRLQETDKPKGIFLESEGNTTKISNFAFEYAALKVWQQTGGIDMSGCLFRYTDDRYGAAVTLGTSGSQHRIVNTVFLSGDVPAVTSGANVQVGLTMEGCTLVDMNTQNTNKPQINITAGGDRLIKIDRCTLRGNQRTMVGGIAVGNMMRLGGSNRVEITNCDVRKHRYGVTGIGSMDLLISGNTLVDNCYETNAMNGGSGISLTDPTGKMTAVISQNDIEQNLWGVTLIYCKNISLGEEGNPLSPGGNVFKDNGNGGVLYDLYNNSANTVYAQQNTWNALEQTATEIEKVIFHKADDASLGEVIYMPAKETTGVQGVKTLTEGGEMQISGNELLLNGVQAKGVSVYSLSGELLEKADIHGGKARLYSLSNKGAYIVRVTTESGDVKSLKIVR